MAQDMSAQGPAGLSNPGLGAKLNVQEHGGFEAAGEQSGSNSITAPYTGASAFAAQDKSSQGAAGTTNKMVNSIEATRAFGAGN